MLFSLNVNLNLCLTGKTVILTEKARRLAEQGRNVTFIVSFDDYNLATKQREPLSASDHFLYRDLTSRFAHCREHLTLEFVNVWRVWERVSEIAVASVESGDEVNIFVDEYSFNFPLSEGGVSKTEFVPALTVPEVNQSYTI